MTQRKMTRRQVLGLLAALGVGRDALAQNPVRTDPRSYRMVLENDRIRVLEYRSSPGMGVCGNGTHYHPAHLTIALSPVKVRVVGPDGKTKMAEAKVGQLFYSEAETHSVENIGGSGARAYMVELKDANWKPSTG